MSHNYLALVNDVLTRLREDAVTTLASPDDNVVVLIKQYVNDAKKQVEQAHNWNALNAEWTEAVTASDPFVGLTSAGKYARIESIYRSDGNELRLQTLQSIRHRAAQPGSQTNPPIYFATDGLDTNGDVRLRLWPTPSEADTLTVYGTMHEGELVNDTDTTVLPHLPITLLAYAYAAGERGEAGGAPTAELLAIANQSLSDHIALDASLNVLDDVWYS